MDLANKFVDQTVEAARTAHEAGAAFFIEHPEDLGATSDGQLPASIFSSDTMFQLCKSTGARTGAFHQCHWGASTSKPTRVVSTLDIAKKVSSNVVYLDWPKFNKKGAYLGPLPRSCGHKLHTPLLGRTSDDKAFKTAGAASYPAAMCKWIADLIIEFCKQPEGGVMSPEQNLEGSKDRQAEAESEPGSSDGEEPQLKDHLPGWGRPLAAVWGGKHREFTDGCGLCSPGRWKPSERKPCIWKATEELNTELKKLLQEDVGSLAKLCLKLACGHCESSPFSVALLRKGRELLAAAVIKSGSTFSLNELLEVREIQPFYLRLIGEVLRLMGDPDWNVFFADKRGNFWEGVSVGLGIRMPRTPAVFEKKTKYRRYDDSEFQEDMNNYTSAAGPAMAAVLENQFQEESDLGFMFKMSLEDARREYPRLRIAAQGAIEKADGSWRVLHDGTHGVRVNNEVKLRDQIRMPSAGDQRSIMQESAEYDPGVHFSVQFDVSKAHRRFLHRKADWGLLACRANDDLSEVWINRVGTFGLSCASYWWSRLAAGLGRLTLRFFSQAWVIQLLFADDNRLQAAGKDKFENLALAIFLWVLCGTPLSWNKCKGGLSCEWIGYWLDYRRFELGISRAAWLIQWGQRVVGDGLVSMREFASGLGRLGFCSGVLEYFRPFLAGLYAWGSAAPLGAVLPVPPLVRLTLSWIVQQLKEGRNMTMCRKPAKDLGLWFKTDAKGEGDYVTIGGWECKSDIPTGQARWFSLTLTAKEADWLFARGHASRTIAASELLATLVAVHLFVPAESSATPERTRALTRCRGLTDNAGNAFVVAKLLTTKFPLAAVLMQLATMLSSRGLWLDLEWVCREDNVEADALTNSDFSLFDPSRRIPVCWADIPHEVLTSLVSQGEAFLVELEGTRALKKTARQAPLDGIRMKRRRKVREPWG